MDNNIDQKVIAEMEFIVDILHSIVTKNVVMLVGLPGSGKTMLRNVLVDKCDYSVISRDDITEDVCKDLGLTYKDAFFGKNSSKIQKIVNKRLSDHIKGIIELGQNAIIDMTCLTKSSRAKKIAPFNKDYIKVAIEVFRDASSLLKLNTEREFYGRNLYPSQLLQMAIDRESVTLDEGFNTILRFGLTKQQK